jgi:copper chaperone CopZ
MTQTTELLTYPIPGVSCGQCQAAITAEVEKLEGVASVDVDLETKRVSVAGERLDDAAIRAAIDEAGYDLAGAAAEPRSRL